MKPDLIFVIFILLPYFIYVWSYLDVRTKFVDLMRNMSGYYLEFPNRHSNGIQVVRCIQPDSSSLWKVSKDTLYVLTKTGEFIFEPLPSSRTDEFYKETRFQTFDEAVAAYRKLKNGK